MKLSVVVIVCVFSPWYLDSRLVLSLVQDCQFLIFTVSLTSDKSCPGLTTTERYTELTITGLLGSDRTNYLAILLSLA